MYATTVEHHNVEYFLGYYSVIKENDIVKPTNHGRMNENFNAD